MIHVRRFARSTLGAPLVLPLALASLMGCKEKEFHPPDREQQVADAEALLTPETFDTISWASEDVRALQGNVTFSAKCAVCHGPEGRGGTEYAAERGLEVPSLVEPEWAWADSLAEIRRRIFVGHAAGMPTWGVAGITPREIDGAAYYVMRVLRPEMTGSSP